MILVFWAIAGPGDLGIDRSGFVPDWRAQAKHVIGELKQGNGQSEPPGMVAAATRLTN